MLTSEHHKTESIGSKVTSDLDNKSFSLKPTLKKMLAFSLALLGAAVLWFLSALNHNYTSYIKYPIKIVYDPNKYIPVSKLPTYVSLNATGYGWEFLQKTLSLKRKPVLLKPTDLSQKRYFTQTELLNAFSHQLPKIKVNFFETDTLFFTFDQFASKKIYLKVDTLACSTNFFPKDKQLNFNINPSSMLISGSKTEIQSLSDTLILKVIGKELEIGFNETLEVPIPKKLSTLKADATEIDVLVEAK